MAEEKKKCEQWVEIDGKMVHRPWGGWRPGSGKQHDPGDPHFNPMHPPEGYPIDELWKEWFGEDWEKEKAAWEQEQSEKQAESK